MAKKKADSKTVKKNDKPIQHKPTSYQLQKIELIKSKASEHFTLTQLLESCDVPHTTYAEWCKIHPDLSEFVKDSLKKSFTVRQTRTEQGAVELTFTFDEIRRRRGQHYTEEEKTKLIDIICYAFERGVSILDASKAMSLDYQTFYNWVLPTSSTAFQYGVERYKQSKEMRKSVRADIEVFTARASLASKLAERKVVNETRHYEVKGLEGEVKLIGKTEHEVTKEADMSAIQFVLNNLDEDFKKTIEIKDDDSEFVNMTAEEIEAEIVKEQQKRLLLENGEGEWS